LFEPALFARAPSSGAALDQFALELHQPAKIASTSHPWDVVVSADESLMEHENPAPPFRHSNFIGKRVAWRSSESDVVGSKDNARKADHVLDR
jgi:hypothetical protein